MSKKTWLISISTNMSIIRKNSITQLQQAYKKNLCQLIWRKISRSIEIKEITAFEKSIRSYSVNSIEDIFLK